MKFGIVVLLIAFLTSCMHSDNTSYADAIPAVAQRQGLHEFLIASQTGEYLNIYSSRHFEADEEIFRRFTQETGIGINVIHATSGQIVSRLALEGERTGADLIIAADGGILSHAKAENLLQPISSDILSSQIPANLRDPDNYWYAMSYRARVIAVANDIDIAVEKYEDLGADVFSNEVLLRPGNSLYNVSLLASLIDIYGFDDAFEWAKNTYNNSARHPQGNDRDQITGIFAGTGSVTLINSYYLGLMASSNDAMEIAAADSVSVVFPNQQTSGTHINISGMAVSKHANNPEIAVQFMEFMTREDMQSFISEVNFEFPVNQQATLNPFLQQLGDFKIQQIDFSSLHTNHIRAVEIMTVVGW